MLSYSIFLKICTRAKLLTKTWGEFLNSSQITVICDIIDIRGGYVKKVYIPTIERKEEAIDYYNEQMKYHSDFNGSGSIDRFLKA